jgi:hypothetical protein
VGDALFDGIRPQTFRYTPQRRINHD